VERSPYLLLFLFLFLFLFLLLLLHLLLSLFLLLLSTEGSGAFRPLNQSFTKRGFSPGPFAHPAP